jgi:hypothetical protein
MGRSVTYLCAPDEGHGYHKPVNNLAAMGAAEVFLGKTLHARYQEEMKEDAKKRLAEITVDVSKLTLPKKVEIAALKTMPASVTDFKAGITNYTVMLDMQGTKIPMELTRTITDMGGNWLVTDHIKGAMGEQSDEVTYTKGTLQLVSRKVAGAGPQVENISYASNKVTVSGKTVDVDGAYIVDGAGQDMIIARMPLKEGYEVGLYVAGQDGKVNLNQLKVLGTEKVGETMCYKATLTSVDDATDVSTYYIGITDRQTYKTLFPLDGVPGAVLTMELKK